MKPENKYKYNLVRSNIPDWKLFHVFILVKTQSF